MIGILDRIVADKRIEIERRKRIEPAGSPIASARPGFIRSLRAAPIGLIAEIKRRSPSAGVIREPFDPAAIARDYEAAGAQAISVLMDEKYFGGGEAQFNAVRAAAGLPLLYKEFVVDAWQIRRAAALGASAVLLIAAVLGEDELKAMLALCAELGLDALVEVHDEPEMGMAAGLGAPCVGINNRNLKTFKTSLETTFALHRLAPAGCTLVSESGIRTAEDIRRLREAGVHAVLVGESLLRQPDLQAAVRTLMAR